MTYSEKLKLPAWQKKRLQILNRDLFTCCLCTDDQSTLHIHHKAYIKGREPWDYEDDNFLTLCKYCHGIVEFFKNDMIQPLHITRVFNAEWNCYFITLICLSDFGLGIVFFRYYEDGTIQHVLSLKKSTLEGFSNILKNAEKLLPKV